MNKSAAAKIFTLAALLNGLKGMKTARSAGSRWETKHIRFTVGGAYG